MSQQMFLNDTPLCRYLEKVFAEAPNDFEAFKGAETSTKGTFVGTYKLDSSSDCKLTRIDNGNSPSEYRCTVGQAKYFFNAGRSAYDLSRENLRACLFGWVFQEKRRGGEMTG